MLNDIKATYYSLNTFMFISIAILPADFIFPNFGKKTN